MLRVFQDKFRVKMDTISFGYQGLGNIGDDLMHLCVLEKYKAVVVRKGRRLRDTDHEVSTVIFFLMTIFAKKLIFTGGNIFSVETKKSYLKLAFFMAITKLRKLSKLETEFHSIGLNREVSAFALFLTAQILKSASYIHVRDEHSYGLATDNGINSNLNADIVLTSQLSLLNRPKLINKKKSYVVYFPSVPGEREGKRINTNFELEDNVFQGREGYSIIQSPEDEYRAAIHFPNSHILRYEYDKLSDMLDIIQSADFIITERLHGAILAERFKVPFKKSNNTEKLRNIYLQCDMH